MKVFVIATLLIVSSVRAEEITVKTDKGVVKGVREDDEDGFYHYSFKGIRYAQPPTEKLRFKAPVEVESWTGEFDATDDGNICPQYDISSSSAIGDEDCLNLNVFTPKLDKKKRPVMVYIHGGAFIMGGGSASFFGPRSLLEQDFVIVTFNYRLGAFGFLATDDKASSGNMGLQDQIMALKWVKNNIEKFGGDTNKITLFGESAGAASISFLTLSPLAQGLFHSAIQMSGNALCDQYIQNNPMDGAADLAVKLECSTETGSDIVECLKRQTQQDIVTKSNELYMFYSFPRWFAPTVDGHVIPDTPETLLAQGKFYKVPTMLGQTKNEGAFFYRLIINSFNNGAYDDNFVDHKLPRILPVISSFTSKLYPITRQVRKKYFVNVDMENEDEFRPKFVDFLTDLMFTRSIDKYAQYLANNSVPAYKYSFEYRGQYSIVNLQGEQVDMGIAHGDDLQYLFNDIWGEEFTISPSDAKFAKNVFIPLVANFVKTSVPTPQITDSINVAWTPMAPGKNRVYIINKKVSLETDYKEDVLKFWHQDIPALMNKKSKKSKSKDEL